jgi:hypothetical protein
MQTDRSPIGLHAVERPDPEVQAAEHLRFIRDVMSRSGSFTAVPGKGMMGMGGIALCAAILASMQANREAWLTIWLIAAVLAITVGGITSIRKARVGQVPLQSGPGRKYVLSLLPPMIAGALLTAALWDLGQDTILPALWLLLYGAGTMTGGAFSVKAVPMMGVGFMALGIVALFIPFTWADTMMGLGFGGLHLIFGWIIAKNYGG